jgi:hypothetical protein
MFGACEELLLAFFVPSSRLHATGRILLVGQLLVMTQFVAAMMVTTVGLIV